VLGSITTRVLRIDLRRDKAINLLESLLHASIPYRRTSCKSPLRGTPASAGRAGIFDPFQ